MIGNGRGRISGTSAVPGDIAKMPAMKLDLAFGRDLLVEPVSPPVSRPGSSYVIISGDHDYRSKRKVDLHFIADELKKQARVSFISLRYSYLTRNRQDPRHDLWDRANRVEVVDDVACFLWRTPLHPFGLPDRLALLERLLFSAFSSHLNGHIRKALQNADVALVESGLPIIYIPLLKRLNPRLRIIYMASDSVNAIGQAGAVKQALKANASLIGRARVPSPFLALDVPPGVPCHFIPHGIEKAQFAAIGPSPFAPGTHNAVSVGSTLFDPSFFGVAAALFPDITFHVIGSGYNGFARPNVRYYPEMPIAATLRHIKHGSFAIAPYRRNVEAHLTHTSVELMQYNHLGVPVVCPHAVAGVGLGRFGYDAADPQTIRAAIGEAMRGRTFTPQEHLTWQDVARALAGPDNAEPTLKDASHVYADKTAAAEASA
jgi:2-beta-glucuronyltransferase